MSHCIKYKGLHFNCLSADPGKWKLCYCFWFSWNKGINHILIQYLGWNFCSVVDCRMFQQLLVKNGTQIKQYIYWSNNNNPEMDLILQNCHLNSPFCRVVWPFRVRCLGPACRLWSAMIKAASLNKPFTSHTILMSWICYWQNKSSHLRAYLWHNMHVWKLPIC